MVGTFTNQHRGIRTIDHRYQVIGILGEGGMGVAYKVRDRLTEDIVTLKSGLPLERFSIGRDKRKRRWKDLTQPTLDPVSIDANTTPTDPTDPGSRDTVDNQSLTIGTDSTLPGVMSLDAITVLPGDEGPVSVSPSTEVSGGRTGNYNASGVTRNYSQPMERLILAQEFELLAGLRHPNIIAVLDYGFDEDQQPYFTMELVEDAQDLLAASRQAAMKVRIAYLAQTLGALIYLHRRGVIHRDLKPSNVLVSGGQVKVLDFGISLRAEEAPDQSGIAGTFGYIAPEIMLGKPPGVSSDLYAFGALASQVLFGQAPSRLRAIKADALPGATASQVANLRALVERLTVPEPSMRPASARATLDLLMTSVGLSMPEESVDARESFLQAADFVGRSQEMADLRGGLKDAMRGLGSVRLIGGESGVGKSRLLREFRTMALVDGVMVIGGQAFSHEGSPYQLWRSVLRNLVLSTELEALELSALKPLVPDIGRLVLHGAEVPDIQAQSPEAAQGRLIQVIEDILRRQARPVVLLLEDLHWAGEESLKVIEVLSKVIGSLRIMIIGSFRDDEGSHVRKALHHIPTLKLQRLSDRDIRSLSESIIGPSARYKGLQEMLRTQTHGNPFFVVEMLRAWAEVAGRLELVTEMELPTDLLPEGISALLRRRLDTLPEMDRALLRLAAVTGRDLDHTLLVALEPDQDWRSAMTRWVGQSVLAIEEGIWRFAHDKIREQLLAELDELDLLPRNHRRVASAIEEIHGESDEVVHVLAYHWSVAGDTVKEAHYTGLAGELALRLGANQEAIRLLSRALALSSPQIDIPDPPGAGPARFFSEIIGQAAAAMPGDEALRIGRLEGRLSEAHGRFGEHSSSIEHARRALAWLGQPMPESTGELVGGTLAQILLRTLQSNFPARYTGASTPDDALQLAAEIQTRVTETFIYSQETKPLLWSVLRMLNMGNPAGPTPHLARAYALTVVLLGIVPLHGLAETCSRRGMEIADTVGRPYEQIFMRVRVAIYKIYIGAWDEVESLLGEALKLATEVRDPRQRLESLSVMAIAECFRGTFKESLAHQYQVIEEATRQGDLQVQLWSTSGASFALLRMRRFKEAGEMCARAAKCVNHETPSADAILFHGQEALLHLRLGEHREALTAADAVYDLVVKQAPVAYWTYHGMNAAAEVYLTLQLFGVLGDHKDKAQKITKALAAFGKKVPFAQSAALRWQGLLEHLKGNRKKAAEHLQGSLDVAQRLDMPYDQGRAHLELARIDSASSHLKKALALLQPLGSVDPDATPHHAETVEVG